MVLKYIICDVPENHKKDFSKAQSKWTALKKQDGLVCQFGGWDLSNPNLAHIFGFWENRAALDHFMEEGHDLIFKATNQSDYYSRIQTSVLKVLNPDLTFHLNDELETLNVCYSPEVPDDGLPHPTCKIQMPPNFHCMELSFPVDFLLKFKADFELDDERDVGLVEEWWRE